MNYLIRLIRKLIGYTAITGLVIFFLVGLGVTIESNYGTIHLVSLSIIALGITLVWKFILPGKVGELSPDKTFHHPIPNFPQGGIVSEPQVILDLERRRSSISSAVQGGVKRGGWDKLQTEELLGCTIDSFTTYIEMQFEKGMTWHNHGDWHYDHKVPVTVAQTKEEAIKLSHYSNFQPMWSKDNLSKGGKMLDEHVELRIKLIGR